MLAQSLGRVMRLVMWAQSDLLKSLRVAIISSCGGSEIEILVMVKLEEWSIEQLAEMEWVVMLSLD